jgi:putative peptidoglycan lipid II flippase
MLPATLGAGVYQVNVAINTVIAMRLPEGAVSSLGYSNRFMEFVLGIFVIALSTVSLTSFSRIAAAGRREELAARATEVFRLVLFVTIPSTVGLWILREPAISLILRSGQFQERSLDLTVAAFRFHLLGLAFVGLVRVLVATCHSQKDIRSPIVASLFVLPVNLALAAVLSSGPMGHTGIALASSVAAGVHAVLLFEICRFRLPTLRLRPLLAILFQSGIGSAVMAAVCLAALWAWPVPEGKLLQALWLLVIVAAGAAVYFGVTAALRVDECRVLLGSLLRRRGSRD